MGAVVYVVKLSSSPQAERFLDMFEAETNTAGERLADGRRYTLLNATDWESATEGIAQVLTRIAGDERRDHLGFLDPKA